MLISPGRMLGQTVSGRRGAGGGGGGGAVPQIAVVSSPLSSGPSDQQMILYDISGDNLSESWRIPWNPNQTTMGIVQSSGEHVLVSRLYSSSSSTVIAAHRLSDGTEAWRVTYPQTWHVATDPVTKRVYAVVKNSAANLAAAIIEISPEDGGELSRAVVTVLDSYSKLISFTVHDGDMIIYGSDAVIYRTTAARVAAGDGTLDVVMPAPWPLAGKCVSPALTASGSRAGWILTGGSGRIAHYDEAWTILWTYQKTANSYWSFRDAACVGGYVYSCEFTGGAYYTQNHELCRIGEVGTSSLAYLESPVVTKSLMFISASSGGRLLTVHSDQRIYLWHPDDLSAALASLDLGSSQYSPTLGWAS